MLKLNCLDSLPTLFDFINPAIAPQLLYYAYIPIAILSLLVGLFVIRSKSTFSLPNKLFFVATVLFSLYITDEILLWTMTPASFVHFGWVLIAVFFILINLSLLYFYYTYTYKSDLNFFVKISMVVLTLPIFLLLPTQFNMQSFDIGLCEANTGFLFVYIYALMGIACAAVSLTGLYQYMKTKKPEMFFVALGTSVALMTLLFSDALGEVTGDFEINLIGPVGMLTFLIILAFLIVKYHIFNIKLAAAQALVVGLVFLIGSLFFFAEGTTDYVLITITFILASIGGYFLVRSVKKEIKQREEIELLAMRLEVANERLKELDKMKSEFVSIASHQLRGPITSIRGYASMLVEGSYGKLPERAKEVLEKLVESSKFMALSIEDYLNVSRIEAGNMKYELSDFNLREIAEKVVDEMRPVAMKKGLVLVYRSDTNGSNMVHADVGKTRQVIMNLIDNSIKYTPKGTITVVAHDDMKSKLMCITIQDTGIGMSKETIEGMFDKFVRAKNANSVNVTGTGLGLFVAKKMITQMNGRVWAESEGEGKGSTFHIELPLLSGKAGR